MKKVLVLPAVFAASALRAGPPALPEFNSQTLTQPPLSLQDIARGAMPPLVFQPSLQPPRPTLAALTSRPAGPKVDRTSGMPILEPNSNVDYKLIVQAPDSAIDFKMIVKAPAEQAKQPAK